MTQVQDLGAARYIRKMSKEMADQKEAGGREACRAQTKELDKEEVGALGEAVGVSGNRWASWGRRYR